MNTRAKMRRSNQKVIKYLLDNGFDCVWLMPHMRWDQVSYFSEGGVKLKSKDMFGVGDGVAISKGTLYLLQIKTNSKVGFKEFEKFLNDFGIAGVFAISYDHRGVEAHILNSKRRRLVA